MAQQLLIKSPSRNSRMSRVLTMEESQRDEQGRARLELTSTAASSSAGIGAGTAKGTAQGASSRTIFRMNQMSALTSMMSLSSPGADHTSLGMYSSPLLLASLSTLVPKLKSRSNSSTNNTLFTRSKNSPFSSLSTSTSTLTSTYSSNRSNTMIPSSSFTSLSADAPRQLDCLERRPLSSMEEMMNRFPELNEEVDEFILESPSAFFSSRKKNKKNNYYYTNNNNINIKKRKELNQSFLHSNHTKEQSTNHCFVGKLKHDHSEIRNLNSMSPMMTADRSRRSNSGGTSRSSNDWSDDLVDCTTNTKLGEHESIVSGNTRTTNLSTWCNYRPSSTTVWTTTSTNSSICESGESSSTLTSTFSSPVNARNAAAMIAARTGSIVKSPTSSMVQMPPASMMLQTSRLQFRPSPFFRPSAPTHCIENDDCDDLNDNDDISKVIEDRGSNTTTNTTTNGITSNDYDGPFKSNHYYNTTRRPGEEKSPCSKSPPPRPHKKRLQNASHHDNHDLNSAAVVLFSPQQRQSPTFSSDRLSSSSAQQLSNRFVLLGRQEEPISVVTSRSKEEEEEHHSAAMKLCSLRLGTTTNTTSYTTANDSIFKGENKCSIPQEDKEKEENSCSNKNNDTDASPLLKFTNVSPNHESYGKALPSKKSRVLVSTNIMMDILHADIPIANMATNPSNATATTATPLKHNHVNSEMKMDIDTNIHYGNQQKEDKTNSSTILLHAPTPVYANKTIEETKLYVTNICHAFDSWNENCKEEVNVDVNVNVNNQSSSTTFMTPPTKSYTKIAPIVTKTSSTFSPRKRKYHKNYNHNKRKHYTFSMGDERGVGDDGYHQEDIINNQEVQYCSPEMLNLFQMNKENRRDDGNEYCIHASCDVEGPPSVQRQMMENDFLF